MKKSLFLLIVMFLLATSSWAQLSGQKYIPGSGGIDDYATIKIAIDSLNAQGVGGGGVTFNVAVGYTETIAEPLSITATGTAANPIIFRKADAGTHPLITAYSTGIATPDSTVQDGIWNFIGSDYVTIDGIDLYDPNTTNPATMEYGYGFFKASATDGCQYNTIQNCVVTLNRENNALGGSLAVDGSRAINVVNAFVTDQKTDVLPTTTAGTNSYNKFYSNTLQNCNIGIALIGYADVSPYSLCDFGNDIGGSSALTGNAIINFGGATAATNPAAAVRTLAQYDINVSYNTINNNNGSGVNHLSTLRGIFLNTSVNANSTITYNTVTLKNNSKANPVSAIENVTGSGSAVSNTIRISNNFITNCTNDSTNVNTGIWYGIYNNSAYSSASAANLIINNNTFSNNTSKATNSATYIIYNSNGKITNLDSICGNQISYSHIGTTALSAGVWGINNNGADATCDVFINNNNFSNFNFNVAGTSILYFINTGSSAVTPYTLTVSNNTWTNLTLNHSGTEYLCYVSCNVKGPAFNFTNNYIAGNLNRTSAVAGTFYGLYNTGTMDIGTIVTLTDNDFSNITASGTSGGATIIYEGSSSPVPYSLKLVHNNIVSNITHTVSTGTVNGLQVNYMGPGITATPSKIYDNTITGISTFGTITGLNLGATTSMISRYQAYNNTVNTLTSSGTSSTVTGVTLSSSGAGADFFKHNIYNIKASGASASAYGISIPSGGVNTNVYNNFISDIKATSNTNTSNTDGVRGISITSTSVTSNINLYYNTIYLDATSTGTNFSSSAVFHTAPSSTIATTAVLNMQNNILVNNSTPKGTGIASAFRRNWPTYGIATISPSCNFNCFYAGAPDTKHLIFYDGTNLVQTMAAYQAVVTDRDLQSFRENPPFTNIALLPYDLHLTTSTPTQCESGGQQIAGITTDFDEDVRFGSVVPAYTGTGTLTDVGADEGDFFMASDVISPAIVYTPAPNTPYATTTITATITDPSGLPTSGIGLPVLKWKINVPGTWNTATATSLGNNQYSFTFGNGAVTNDSILYYVAAQDFNYNVGAYPFLGATIPTFDPPGFTTPPTNLNKFKKLAAISGVYTIDTTMATGGTNFKTFTDAVNFLNAAGITAPVTFNVAAGQSWAITCSGSPLSALRITNTGATATNTVTFERSGLGANPVINVTGTSGSSDYGIYLEDTKYIIFDGINVVDAGTSASNWVEYGIYLKGTSIGCQYNTIKNSEVNLERNNTNATYGIYSFSAASPFVGTNSFNKFYNNSIKDCRIGYYITGVSTTYKDTLNEIGNIASGVSLVQGIGSSTVTGAPFGIYGKYQEGLKVFNTIIDTVVGFQSITTGMEINQSSNLSVYGNTLKNLTKTGINLNSDIYIMNITTSTTGTNNIYNNTMFDCSIPATFAASCNLNGIRAYDGTSNWNIYGNTVYNLRNARGAVTGIYHHVGSGSTTVNIFNNKINNLQSDTTNSWIAPIFGGYTGASYSVYNNYVYDIKNAASTIATQPAIQGISVAGGNWTIFNNTVYLDYVSSNEANTSACLYVASATPIVDIRNNIFVNKCDMTMGARAVAFWYTGGLPYSNIAATSDNNLYYSGIPSPKNLIFCDSLAPITTIHFIQTLDDYKTLTGIEANSVTEDPPFVSNVSPYNLHMQTTVPTITEGKGQFIATVPTDYDGDVRNATTPDIGADEFSGIAVVQCNGTPAATSIIGAASICTNTSTALTLSPVVTDLGVTHQWAYSTTPGGPYTQLGTFNGQNTGNISVPTYYIDTITCTNSGLYYVTAEKSVMINQYPVSSAAVTVSPICANATLNLLGTTDIGTSFNWTGPNNFTSTSQNPSIPSSTIAASGTYSFTSTSNGCISPVVTVSAIVNQTPSTVIVTPSSTSLCAGNIQTLTTTGGIVYPVVLYDNFNDTVFSYSSWTRINNSTGGIPENAAWTIMPDSTKNDIGTFRSNDKSSFFLTNSYAQGTSGTKTETMLQSPSFSTLNFTSATIEFYQYYFKHATTDTARVQVSTDGTNWTTLQTYLTGQGQVNIFLFSSVALTAPFLNQATVYIRFYYNTITTYGYCWAIDNVRISGVKLIQPTWSPINGLYSDAGATTPYVLGTVTSTVYAKPDAGVSNYNATATTDIDNCSITSNTAVVTVAPPSVGGTATATDTVVNSGTGTTINLIAYTGNIQWQSSPDGSSWSTINGETLSALSTGNLTVTTYYKAIVTSGVCSSVASNSVKITVALPVPGLWTGAVSTDWSVGGNWNDGLVPTSSVNVVIPSTTPNQPHVTKPVSDPAVCNDLTINNAANLTIDAGKALTVSGSISNNSGTTGLVLKSSISGTASLLHSNSSVDATVESYIPHTNTDEFHMLASPVAAQTIAPDFNQLNGFYVWNEPTGAWIEYADAANFAASNGGTNFVPGKGYAVSYPAVTTKSFVGALNQGIVYIPLSVTTGSYEGWNFVANPYPSSVNWDASGWSRFNLDDAGGSESAMWIWNATLGNYGTYISNAGSGTGTNNVTADIPISQGFWVKAISTGALGMNNNVRIHSTQAYLKSTSASDRVRLAVTGSANTYSDEIIVKFGNTDDLGGAPKMFSIDATAPSLYSVKLNKNWSINYLTTVDQYAVVDVGFKAGVSGIYTIKASEINSFTTPTYVYLKDLATNTLTDLNQNANYAFAATSTDNAMRFQLLFALSPLSISNNGSLTTSIYSYNNTIYINSNETIKQIAVYNTLGQIIKTISNKNAMVAVDMKSYATGNYIVRVVTTKNVYSEKVLVK